MKLRAGFIGFGRMGITHYSILNSHPSAQIVAVSDKSSTMLKILEKYLSVPAYTNYEKMIEEQDLDFVVISTPTDSHAEINNYAIENSLHVFSEKPLAISVEEGKGILDKLDDKPLVNQIGYVNRFNEIFMEVKRIVDSGIIGQIKTYSSEMYGPTVLKDTSSSWRGKRKTGGGCLYEFGSHCIDLALYLLGQPDKVVGSIMQSIYSSAVEDFVSSSFIYNNGCSGTIMVNWSDESYRKPTNIIKILGTKGKIVADKHAYKIFLKEANQDDDFHKGWNTRYITDFAKSVRFYVRGNEFTRQLDYFVDCINQGCTDNIASFAEALKTDIVMEAIANDASQSLAAKRGGPQVSPILPKSSKRASIWSKFLR